MRGFWLHMGHPGGPTRADFALRLCGSSDLFENRLAARRPSRSTMSFRTTASRSPTWSAYNERHNHANGENNRDGHRRNLSFNCGVEGPSDDPRSSSTCARRLQRALLASALLAQGTPMLAAGDELGHGQRGNNNPYCQDNETTWIDWAAADQQLIDIHRRSARACAATAAARPRAGTAACATAIARRSTLAWLRSDGQPLEGDAWRNPASAWLGCLIGRRGRVARTLLLLVNGDSRRPRVPRCRPADWRVELDSSQPSGRSGETCATVEYALPAHALVLLTRGEIAPG